MAELEARSRLGTVRNAVAYLFALIRRVLAGEFRLWAATKPLSDSLPATPSAAPLESRAIDTPVRGAPVAPKVVQAHIAAIRALLHMPAAHASPVWTQPGHTHHQPS